VELQNWCIQGKLVKLSTAPLYTVYHSIYCIIAYYLNIDNSGDSSLNCCTEPIKNCTVIIFEPKDVKYSDCNYVWQYSYIEPIKLTNYYRDMFWQNCMCGAQRILPTLYRWTELKWWYISGLNVNPYTVIRVHTIRELPRRLPV
jgi:hypothetical protein